MLRSNYLKKVSYKNRKNINKAAAAVLRNSVVAARRSTAPPRTGGFYGYGNRRVGTGPEIKTIDSGSVGPQTVFDTAGSVLLINGVAQGDDYNARQGRKIQMQSVLCRISVWEDPNSNFNSGEIGRIMLVYDMQANGVAPTVANILQNSTWDSPNNLDNRNRFKTLYDKEFVMEAANFATAALTNGAPRPRIFKFYKKLNLPVTFSGTGATVGAISTGSLYLLYITANTSNSLISYTNTRVRFVDP